MWWWMPVPVGLTRARAHTHTRVHTLVSHSYFMRISLVPFISLHSPPHPPPFSLPSHTHTQARPFDPSLFNHIDMEAYRRKKEVATPKTDAQRREEAWNSEVHVADAVTTKTGLKQCAWRVPGGGCQLPMFGGTRSRFPSFPR